MYGTDWRQGETQQNNIIFQLTHVLTPREHNSIHGNTWHDGRRYHQKVNARGSRPVTHQRNVVGVAAEESDVLLDPVEHGYLIHETVVGHASPRIGRSVGVQKSWKNNKTMGWIIIVIRHPSPKETQISLRVL